MKKVIVKFRDKELGDDLVQISYDDKKYNFKDIMNMAKDILYLDFDSEYEELKEEYPDLTKELYDICMKVLDNGNYGVITERFCEFLELAFKCNWKIIEDEYAFNVEYGYWD